MEKILLKELKDNEGKWLKKVSLYVLGDLHGYSPETVGRTLRHLEETGQIEKGYYNGKFAKGLVQYSYKPKTPKIVLKEIDGIMTAVYA